MNTTPVITPEDRAKLSAAGLAKWPRPRTDAETEALYAQIKREVKSMHTQKRQPWREIA